ncbi:U-box domain-containing protein 3 [Impatiens glandulifera]|uniref:U-box domain-containing protein 3 n=1 Tax=Impatiens glandulifera TaxID=253017 RepID=UPI001FB0A197|nr:U-box domain-containing protein 3 [Impatiens glandulifera]
MMEEEEAEETWNHKKQVLMEEVAFRLVNGDLDAKIQAAREIRTLVRRSSTNARSKIAASGVLQPLISMLTISNIDAREASLLALLNLAVRNERNKVSIVMSGAISPLVELLKIQQNNLREIATAAILTLSSAPSNKPTIIASGAIPLLVQILRSGNIQGRVDAVTALHNLFAFSPDNPNVIILDSKAACPLINLLKECKKNSKFAEKATALIEILCQSEEGLLAVAMSDGGILALVETVEDGSKVSMENAVGALLLLCESCRDKYRELILKEGAIPGLLWMTAEGTAKAQERARKLLDMLRVDKSSPEKITSAESAKMILQDMVHRSMKNMQLRDVGSEVVNS